MKRVLLIMLSCCVWAVTYAQETFPRNGVKDERPEWYAFTHARIHVDYQNTLENATLVIKKGKIQSVGANVTVPKGAIVMDMKGKDIYPSFIDLSSTYGVPDAQKYQSQGPQMESKTKGPYSWNEAIKTYYDAASEFSPDDKEAASYRKMGFGTVLAGRKDGIARGTSALVALAEGSPNELIIKEKASANYSFDKGVSQQDYPSSLMGVIALMRQTYLDAQWYTSQKDMKDLALEAFNKNQGLPQIFQVDNKLSVLRADKIGDEFGKQYIIEGAGDEYQRIDEIKATQAPIIVPVDYPDAYDVSDPYDAQMVSLEAMKHWELAPYNLSYLVKAGVPVAITSDGLKNKGEFLTRVAQAITAGLPEQEALKALTYTPAKLLGVTDHLGSLAAGKEASFIITSGTPFAENAVIYQNWVEGKKYEITDIDIKDHRGQYTLSANGQDYKLEISGKVEKPGAKIIVNDSTKLDVKLSFDKAMISMVFSPEKDKQEDKLRLSGWEEGKGYAGKGQQVNGEWFSWKMKYEGPLEEKKEDKKKEEAAADQPGPILYPFEAYGNTKKPTQETILIKHATLWTLEKEGTLEDTDVLLKDGKIAKIGKGLSESGARVIDGTGMHLTPGIIDEHSHIAISQGVNEGTQAVTSEVRIGDVINSEDINIYRQLAGGVVASQLLHGSANPIGGQNALVKLKWGYAPEEMKIKNAPGFIKFALGENVKQSNWGDRYRVRFPQTRMGVEQVYVDAFTRARAYEAKWKAYNALSKREKANTPAPRRDLELDALVEILNSKRFITCHSYVQSEITMLMRVAESFGFRVNTFTHILEGYKVADKMRKHGAGGSTFSDWWAYKFEVRDAIPYNAAIMTEQGITTAINSDDAEMGRRLNQEAAKTVKYGGMSEDQALRMVTINPAKLLHLDDRMGTIKVGKEANVVLWSHDPLSIYSKAMYTIIDGTVFFDRNQMDQNVKQVQEERARLIQKMLDEKKKGKPVQPVKIADQHLWTCDDMLLNYQNSAK